MSRIYGEPVEVWPRDAHPSRFVWRSRLHTVTRLLDHWTTPPTEPAPAGPAGEAPPPSSRDAGAGEPPPEREFWLVEAVAGPGALPRVYELRHDLRTGTWLLSRAWD